ncbi:transposase [Acidobacteria bacterium AH-259-O06]|nr:transposase [Acidobacteria bacterium AH-259-O06]
MPLRASQSFLANILDCACRDLCGEEIRYLFLDGTYEWMRPEAERKEAILVAYGIRKDGRKVFLHVSVGQKESLSATQSPVPFVAP